MRKCYYCGEETTKTKCPTCGAPTELKENWETQYDFVQEKEIEQEEYIKQEEKRTTHIIKNSVNTFLKSNKIPFFVKFFIIYIIIHMLLMVFGMIISFGRLSGWLF